MRFDYSHNRAAVGTFRDRRSAFWPPSGGYQLACLDLAAETPDLGAGLLAGLATLKSAVEAEWHQAKDAAAPAEGRRPASLPETGRRFQTPALIASAMRDIAKHLPGDADRRALGLRADAVERGYPTEALCELAELREDVTLVAGHLGTWSGKDPGGLPTAFACRRDDAGQEFVTAALAERDRAEPYLRTLMADLRLGDLPAFAATRLFFMAGEGNLHPKHIAYFLPEDEGVKESPYKKTYYFRNTHRAVLDAVSAPLAARYVRVGRPFDPAADRFAGIPVLGVLSHEFGHFVHRPATDFDPLWRADHWIVGVLQETAADVFGILLLAEVWAEPLGLDKADVIAYYLAECLRYVDRGLGTFPDSDGMFLQLSYFAKLGALALDGPVLVGEPDVVLAGLRSLARVLAEVLLLPDPRPALAFHDAYGPGDLGPLAPLVEELRRRPMQSVEYVQEHLHVR
ncbi:hypothetical protein [Nonomuraea gerenzanensis]|uniref:Uncharacterized protein n=1 Tax=Nonomuraea gerenzanensis TaxID=93944 RepID=A0A1M4EM29_9ACTN|nr:hypothetical protein [Nonomuraea gerenzanensis]UBU11417.1 hypothetical protein LCN96_45050 [Nonomuraea gerenzanensis]SBO99900.1 conserved hypothetical protein [Nonomuraea gerenzanensis]